ncbi:MAG TPA: hypothetical protein VM290_07415 [Gaiellaceae bacterium]|nr:hypothetical protein [Gaiellaceae bacterium]
MSHILLIANETAAGTSLIETVKERAAEGALVTVVAPVNTPREGYVVYEDTRRAAAGRRLDRTMAALRNAGVAAHGFVVESDPVDAARDALATLEPPPTEILVATHPRQRSGWLRRDVVERIRRVARDIPVEHVVVDLAAGEGEANVLVVANETVLDEQLLATIRERAERSTASFLIVCPQSDPTGSSDAEAERRLRRAVTELRAAGVDAHGQIAHPDPFTAAMHAVRDERVDEIVVSTFAPERSGWLRRDLIGRLRKETGLPVEHVVAARATAEVS